MRTFLFFNDSGECVEARLLPNALAMATFAANWNRNQYYYRPFPTSIKSAIPLELNKPIDHAPRHLVHALFWRPPQGGRFSFPFLFSMN